MDAHDLEPKEKVSASKKLGEEKARELIKGAKRVVVCKGKKVREFPGGSAKKEVVEAMLGSTGNLRAPTIVSGKTVLVGYNDGPFTEVLG